MEIVVREIRSLDMVASVWAIRQFVPGATDASVAYLPRFGQPMLDCDQVAVGVRPWPAAPEKPLPRGTAGSFFAAIVSRYASKEDQRALGRLIAKVDAEVALVAGRHASFDYSEAPLTAALYELNASLGGDREVVAMMSEIFTAWLNCGRDRWERATFHAIGAQFVGNRQMAIVASCPVGAEAAALLFEDGAHVVVLVNGFNLAVRSSGRVRMDDSAFQALVQVSGESLGPEPGSWRAGRDLLVRGTAAEPAPTPSRVHPEELAAVARALLAGTGG